MIVLVKFKEIIFKTCNGKRQLHQVSIEPKAKNFQDKIPRDRWPKKYVTEHQIHTLFRYKLRSGWILVYTVSGTKYEKACTILEAFDHKQYEKRFGY